MPTVKGSVIGVQMGDHTHVLAQCGNCGTVLDATDLTRRAVLDRLRSHQTTRKCLRLVEVFAVNERYAERGWEALDEGDVPFFRACGLPVERGLVASGPRGGGVQGYYAPVWLHWLTEVEAPARRAVIGRWLGEHPETITLLETVWRLDSDTHWSKFAHRVEAQMGAKRVR